MGEGKGQPIESYRMGGGRGAVPQRREKCPYQRKGKEAGQMVATAHFWSAVGFQQFFSGINNEGWLLTRKVGDKQAIKV